MKVKEIFSPVKDYIDHVIGVVILRENLKLTS